MIEDNCDNQYNEAIDPLCLMFDTKTRIDMCCELVETDEEREILKELSLPMIKLGVLQEELVTLEDKIDFLDEDECKDDVKTIEEEIVVIKKQIKMLQQKCHEIDKKCILDKSLLNLERHLLHLYSEQSRRCDKEMRRLSYRELKLEIEIMSETNLNCMLPLEKFYFEIRNSSALRELKNRERFGIEHEDLNKVPDETRTKKQRNDTKSTKRKNLPKAIGISIVLSILFFIGTYIFYLIVLFLIALITDIILTIPGIGNFVDIFILPRDFDVSLQYYISPVLTFVIITFIIDRFNHNAMIRKYTQLFLGIEMCVANLLFLVSNALSGGNVLANIALVIYGIALIVRQRLVQN